MDNTGNAPKVRKIPVIEVPKYSLEDELKEQEELNNFISKPVENVEESLPYDEVERDVKRL